MTHPVSTYFFFWVRYAFPSNRRESMAPASFSLGGRMAWGTALSPRWASLEWVGVLPSWESPSGDGFTAAQGFNPGPGAPEIGPCRMNRKTTPQPPSPIES